MPDKAYVYIAGIEDGEYKEEKLGCMSFFNIFFFLSFINLAITQTGTTYTASTWAASESSLLKSLSSILSKATQSLLTLGNSL